MEKILVTGGCGFVGSNLIWHLLQNSDAQILTLDRYSISGTPHRLTGRPGWDKFKHRVSFLHHDLRSPINPYLAKRIGDIDYLLHLAASSSQPIQRIESWWRGALYCLS
jgi:dTDP-glucose 4,6-dehydratase